MVPGGPPRCFMVQFRQRRPLTPQEFDEYRGTLADAYEKCDSGDVGDIEALAAMLGRHLVTPFYDDRPRGKNRSAPTLRPCVYHTGAAASLTAVCARFGLDPEPYIAFMDESAKAEAAIPAGA